MIFPASISLGPSRPHLSQILNKPKHILMFIVIITFILVLNYPYAQSPNYPYTKLTLVLWCFLVHHPLSVTRIFGHGGEEKSRSVIFMS